MYVSVCPLVRWGLVVCIKIPSRAPIRRPFKILLYLPSDCAVLLPRTKCGCHLQRERFTNLRGVHRKSVSLIFRWKIRARQRLSPPVHQVRHRSPSVHQVHIRNRPGFEPGGNSGWGTGIRLLARPDDAGDPQSRIEANAARCSWRGAAELPHHHLTILGLDHHAISLADVAGRNHDHVAITIGRLHRGTGDFQRIGVLVDDGRERDLAPATGPPE